MELHPLELFQLLGISYNFKGSRVQTSFKFKNLSSNPSARMLKCEGLNFKKKSGTWQRFPI